MDKKILRQKIRNQRKVITAQDALIAGEFLLKQLIDLLNASHKIAIYHASAGEIDVQPIVEYCLSNGKEVYQAIAWKTVREMRFERIYDSQPQQMFVDADYELKQEIKCYNLDLVILPLIAIDNHGYRLGQGGGYYDTTFASSEERPILCGVGYEWQMQDSVPCDEWDKPLDYFASEQKLYKFK